MPYLSIVSQEHFASSTPRAGSKIILRVTGRGRECPSSSGPGDKSTTQLRSPAEETRWSTYVRETSLTEQQTRLEHSLLAWYNFLTLTGKVSE